MANALKSICRRFVFQECDQISTLGGSVKDKVNTSDKIGRKSESVRTVRMAMAIVNANLLQAVRQEWEAFEALNWVHLGLHHQKFCL